MTALLDKVNADAQLAALPLLTEQAQHSATLAPVLTTPAGVVVIIGMAGIAAAGVGVTMALGHAISHQQPY